MKKILALFALVGTVAAAVAVMARNRGQEVGEFAGEWADRAKEAAAAATDTAGGAATDLKDVAKDSAASITETAKDSAAALKDAALDLREDVAAKARS